MLDDIHGSKIMRRMLAAICFALLLFLAATPAYADGGKDQVVFGHDVIVELGDRVDGNLVDFGGNVDVRGEVVGDVVAFGGNIIITGRVGGNAMSTGGNVDLASTALVGKDVVAIGGRVTKAEGANVTGTVFNSPFDRGFRFPWTAPLAYFPWTGYDGPSAFAGLVIAFVRGVFLALVILGLGVGAMVLFPSPLRTVGDTIEAAFLQSSGLGLLTSVLLVALTPLLAITIIGIPAVLVLWPAFFVASLFGLMAVGWVVGRRVCETLDLHPVSSIVTLLFGLSLILLVVVPLNVVSGCLGWFFIWIIILPGLGSVVLTRFGTIPSRPAPPLPHPEQTTNTLLALPPAADREAPPQT